MIHQTISPAFLLWEKLDFHTGKMAFAPLLYPFKRKDGSFIQIGSCTNRSPEMALRCALKWLDAEDLVTRRELSKRGWGVMPLPYIESETYDDMPDELFDEDNIYDEEDRVS